jgi:hypothetical protein
VGRKRKPRDGLDGSLRYSIRRQISNWKNNNQIDRKCVLCESRNHLEADHHPTPFTQIKADFLAKDGNSSVPTEFTFTRGCQPRMKSKDVNFNRRWQRYHLNNASLQWLCKTCNVTKGARC